MILRSCSVTNKIAGLNEISVKRAKINIQWVLVVQSLTQFIFIIAEIQSDMKQDLDCIYKSFEGCGSFYTAIIPVDKLSDNLNRFGIRAIINLSPIQNIQAQYPGQFQLLNLPIEQNQSMNLKEHFQKSFQFFNRKRTQTNILICGNKRNICLVFLYAFLMRKYKYNLAHISKLLGYSSKNIVFESNMLDQLKKISILFENNVQEEDDSQLLDSKIGRRIKRIRYEYTNLAKNSRSSSRSSYGQNKFKNQVFEVSKKIQFTPLITKIDLRMMNNEPQLTLRTHSRHVKRLSDLY